MKKKYNMIYIISFILIIMLPIIFINRIDGKFSQLENRNLAKAPTLFTSEGRLSDGIKENLETWINDNIGFRDQFLKMKARIHLNLFNTSPVSKVEIGEDGFMFYTLDDNMKIANGTYPLNEEDLIDITYNQKAIQKFLNNQGIEYLLVLPPSKVSVYPEKIKGGGQHYLQLETPVDAIEKHINDNSDVNVLNLKTSLLKAKERELVYYKTDTHWNQVGAYEGYKAIIEYFNTHGILDMEQPVNVNFKDSHYKGDIASMMGDVDILDYENFKNTEIISPNAVVVEHDEILEGIKNIANKYNQSYTTTFRYVNPNGNGKKVLMFGDSMFNGWNFTQLMAENFSELTHIGVSQHTLTTGQINQDFIDLVKPDIVIMEIYERFSQHLRNPVNPRIIYPETLKNPSAEIINTTTLTEVEKDKTYSFEITVKNTGDEAWSEERMVRLAIFPDGQDHGYRIPIPKRVEVKPNEEYTFVLNGFQPPPSESIYLEYQMVEEGITWFGDKKRVDISIK